MWPNSRISVMGGEQAASVLTQIKREAMEKAKSSHKWSAEEEEAFRQAMLAKYPPPAKKKLAFGHDRLCPAPSR